ncbi:hypothetical protein ACFCYN_19900 [Gottfriedia sp. NPDC056225]|uniref:hypothetical protein n=1 Tax=Gottfriedia sp. NPDC056225 TaxID=3345751 RepID=UPI001558BD19|nr:hypothetical protein HPK19_05890 [Arthrobacter citreus]
MSNLFDDLFKESGFKERDFGNIFSKVQVPEDENNLEYEELRKLSKYLDKSIFTKDVYDKLLLGVEEYIQIDLSTRFVNDLIWANWLVKRLRKINHIEGYSTFNSF